MTGDWRLSVRPRRPGPVGMAVVGVGYWGPRIVRNVLALGATDLRWVCDRDPDRPHEVLGAQTAVRITPDLDDVLCDDSVEAVAIATPPHTHAELALRCIDAGRHVLIEKPLADSYRAGERIVEAAERRGVVLHCDHTFCYTPAVLAIRDLVAEGRLGTLRYYDSVRVNLGLVQEEVDVFWDLAPHDISILDFVLPGGLHPTEISAHGADPLGTGRDCVGHLTFGLPNDAMVHIHVNWLSPTKIRQMIIGGSKRTLVWDDLNPQQRLSVYDRGVSLEQQPRSAADKKNSAISYRLGDTWSPALQEREPLGQVVAELAGSIRNHTIPRTSGESGLRVLSVLEAVTQSLGTDGQSTIVAGNEVALQVAQ